MEITSNLSPELLEKARKELNEDGKKRNKMLQELKTWIIKNPQIKGISDDKTLLCCLRKSKFSLKRATDLYESCLISLKIFPNYFYSLEFDPILHQMITDCIFLSVPKHDSDGTRIFLFKSKNIERFSTEQLIKCMSSIIGLYILEEQTQICGIKVIIDFSDTPMRIFANQSLSSWKNVMHMQRNSSLVRLKGIFFLNLPSVATAFIQAIINCASEKIKKLCFVLKNGNDLKNYIDVNILPIEYGGKISMEEIVETTRSHYIENPKTILDYKNVSITINEISKWAKNYEIEETVGTFRNLEFD